MGTLKAALKEAAWVFGLSRLMIVLVTYMGVVLFRPNGLNYIPCRSRTPVDCWMAWYHWDAVAFVRIAYQGYHYQPDVGFFPLWPLLIHAGGFFLGHQFPLSYYIAALLLANLFFYGALTAFYLLLCRYLGFEPVLTRKALWYLAFYVYAPYFFAGYSESLFLLLALTIFILLQDTALWRWVLAGLLAGVATLTRSSGVVLLVPFALFYLQRFWSLEARQQIGVGVRVTALLPALLVPLALSLYMLYLKQHFGDPFIYSRMESLFWGRRLSVPGVAFGPALGALFTNSFTSEAALRNLFDIVFTLLPLGILLAGWRLLPRPYLLFALALAVFSLSFPLVAGETLASQPRYLMLAFPIYMVLARWSKRFPRLDQVFAALSIPLLVVNCLLFMLHYWLA
jgi:hypothetical protein